MKDRRAFFVTAILFGLTSVGSANASTFSISIVADNDFAVFSGTTAGVNNLLYQNNVPWMNQVSNLASLTFSLPTGDTMFYLLGMGGGGAENISGTVNGVDITDIAVSMSSDIVPFMTGYDPTGNVSAGTYDASLADVQTSFSHVTWGAPVVSTTDYVITQSPTKIGYHFDTNQVRLFGFVASDVGVVGSGGGGAVPEPASLALLGIGLAGLVASLRCKRQ